MPSTFLSNYFGFNRQQRNGLWVLILISLILFLVRLSLPYMIRPEAMEVQNLPLIEERVDSAYRASVHRYSRPVYDRDAKRRLFAFDPNTVSPEQLQQLGFREKTAATLIKFRSRGFVFREKKDLQKVYGISDRFYAALEPYILLKQKNTPPQVLAEPVAMPPEPKPAPRAAVRTELNAADSAALVALPGIGTAFARRILKYRSILGGYVSIEQLKEVYGFTEELFEKVKPLVEVTNSPVKKTNLNRDDFKTVNRHPYLSYELTKIIFDQRRRAPIDAENLKDLLNDEALYRKLLPYLAFD